LLLQPNDPLAVAKNESPASRKRPTRRNCRESAGRASHNAPGHGRVMNSRWRTRS